MSLASVTLPAQLKVFEQRFKNEVTTDHIKYDWDASHCYSYIEHPVMSEWDDLIMRVAGDDYNYWYDMFADFTNEWLYSHDECPPCAIYINHTTKEVASGCGCHDDLSYEEGLEIKDELTNYCTVYDPSYKDRLPYLITEEA